MRELPAQERRVAHRPGEEGVEKAGELLREAGFTQLELHRLEHDPVNVYVVARP